MAAPCRAKREMSKREVWEGERSAAPLPPSVMAETGCGPLVSSSFTMAPALAASKRVENGVAVLGASPFEIDHSPGLREQVPAAYLKLCLTTNTNTYYYLYYYY